MIRGVTISLLACVCIPGIVNAQGYKLIGAIPIEGTQAWDYLSVDAQNRRLYVAHADEVVVIDLDSDKVVGKITGMIRVHAVVIDHARNLGYISDAGRSEIVVFDPKTFAVKNKISAGTFPDGEVIVEPLHRVLAFNARSHDATVIDSSTGKVVGTVDLGGRPEFPVSDGFGKVFNNIVDRSEIIEIDPVALKVVARWQLAPCRSPTGLAIDKDHHKLFAVCANKMMAVVDANTGKILATPAIGAHPDAALYDPDSNTAFSSNGEGTLTVISASDPYPLIDTVKTVFSARTMAMDPVTHKIYLAAADLGPTPAPTDNDPTPSASSLPGTFRILIYSNK